MDGSLKGLIFDIQRFSVHDGPGIRTTVFFKGCPLRCRWCQNPESLRPHPEIALYPDRCRSALECIRVCPRAALSERGIVRNKCDACGLCTSVCPYGALKLVGRQLTLEALLQEVLRDQPFYEASGGGVTLSGGEPTLHMDFAGAFTQLCYENGLKVGLQTCGLFRWEAFEPFLQFFEFIHFDLKVMDAEQHKCLTGGDNRAILANARKLAEVGVPVIFRMPIVPGYTDMEENLTQVASFLKDLRINMIHLLCYHSMGEAKLARVDFPISPLGIDKEIISESLARSAQMLQAEGLEVSYDSVVMSAAGFES